MPFAIFSAFARVMAVRGGAIIQMLNAINAMTAASVSSNKRRRVMDAVLSMRVPRPITWRRGTIAGCRCSQPEP